MTRSPERYRAIAGDPFFEDVQAHYDLSDAFFALFLDRSMTYSCAYFEREGMSLAEAQRAKIDLALGKLDLRRGQRLLDIGCGWGSTMRRAAEAWGVDVVGLTLSRNQHAKVRAALAEVPTRAEVRLAGWEQFDEPVDRMVSIGAFEHFRRSRYGAFFERCRSLLRDEAGRMLLHTIVLPDSERLRERGVPVRHEDVLFAKFIQKHIFPGGQLVDPRVIEAHAEAAGFSVERIQSLQPHYAMTLEAWAAALESQRDRAIDVAGPAAYETYVKYLTGCARYFRSGHIDVMQFTLSTA